MTDETAAPDTTRFYLRHLALGSLYAVEADRDGVVLAALDLSDEYSKAPGSGPCKHTLKALPLVGHVEDIERINRTRNEWTTFEPECENIHHLYDELLDMEREYLKDLEASNLAGEHAKAMRKRADASSERVHALLRRVSTREPLPLFD